MRQLKQASYNRTFTFVKRLADYVSFGKIAQLSGKEIQTAEAWGREPESNENPFGTGRKNPFDLTLRLIALAHKEDAGLAREIAEIFTDYADYLIETSGRDFAAKGGCVNELLAESAKEHTDIIVAALDSVEPDFERVLVEAKQAQSKLSELAACVKEKIKTETGKTVFAPASNGKAKVY